MKCAVISVLGHLALIMTSAMAAATAKPRSASRSATKIVGGTEANITDHPYMLSLRYNTKHVCGAAIVNNSYAVTSARCVLKYPVDKLTVKAGSNNRTTNGTIFAVTQKIIHESYNPSTLDYDIAVLKINPPFIFNASINATTLPTESFPEGTNCNVTGWGTMKAGASPLQEKLRVVLVPLVSQASCKSSYGAAKVTDRMLCAAVAAGGKDICNGDVGDPLVNTIDGNYTLVGIASWGRECAQKNYPGVYTNVSKVADWIRAHTV